MQSLPIRRDSLRDSSIPTNGRTVPIGVSSPPALTGDEHNDVTKFTYGFIGFIDALLIGAGYCSSITASPEAVGDAVFVGVPVRAQACALIWRHGDCDGREQK